MGLFDFFINQELNWSIELMSHNNDIIGHISRFQKGGHYHKFANNLELGIFLII